MRYLECTLYVVGGLVWIASGYTSLSIAAEPLLPIARESLKGTIPSPVTLWFAVLCSLLLGTSDLSSSHSHQCGPALPRSVGLRCAEAFLSQFALLK
jgi:hypothetical protein